MANTRLCSVDGCRKAHNTHGYCIMHLRRVQKYGSIEKPIDTKLTGSIKNCEYCDKQYYCQKNQFGNRKYCSILCADAAKVGPKSSLSDRFWEKVDIGEPNKCWEWMASRNPNGYGTIRINGKTKTAHRIAYKLANGEIYGGLCVRHKCDNPACVNPSHLELGTHKENMRDMVERGRSHKVGPRGEKARSAKLCAQDVLTIRRLSKSGMDAKDISKGYPITPTAVSMIISRKNWAWLNPE